MGRTLTKRAADVLAYFDRPGSIKGPTEALNGRSWSARAPGCDSNTSADQPSAYATSPTTSPDPYSRPADSDPDYTLDHEEPRYRGTFGGCTSTTGPLAVACTDPRSRTPHGWQPQGACHPGVCRGAGCPIPASEWLAVRLGTHSPDGRSPTRSE